MYGNYEYGTIELGGFIDDFIRLVLSDSGFSNDDVAIYSDVIINDFSNGIENSQIFAILEIDDEGIGEELESVIQLILLSDSVSGDDIVDFIKLLRRYHRRNLYVKKQDDFDKKDFYFKSR